jgi:hypothetical protein
MRDIGGTCEHVPWGAGRDRQGQGSISPVPCPVSPDGGKKMEDIRPSPTWNIFDFPLAPWVLPPGGLLRGRRTAKNRSAQNFAV